MNRTNNIQVFVRVKPSGEMDDDIDGTTECLDIIDQTSLKVTNLQGSTSTPDLQFTFDKVLKQTSSQQSVFQTVAENIISNIFEGINGTIFCYGQTASGKTYTCVGPQLIGDKRGLLPRIIEIVMQKVKNRPENLDLRVKVCLVEIYNEKVTDLLDLTRSNLKLRENKKKGVFIEHATERYISKTQQGNKLLAKGLQNRSVRCSQMNAASSRSHMLFMITIMQSDFASGEARSAKLTVIDLAGSEKVSKIGTEAKLLSETIKINTSLSALGKVIHALTENKNSHIPYRDSKLTRLLQESLGGNSLTNLIVNVSQSRYNLAQTICSLRFGHRAKEIKNSPKINKQYTVEQLQELLEKAEVKIKAQSKMIEQLSRNTKCGGDRLIRDKPLTLHIIDYEDDIDSNADSVGEGSVQIQKKSKSSIKRTSRKESVNNLSARKANLKSQKSANDFNLNALASSLKYIPIQKMTPLTPRFKEKKHDKDSSSDDTISDLQQNEKVGAKRWHETKIRANNQIILKEQHSMLQANLQTVQNQNRQIKEELRTVLMSLQHFKNQAKIKEQIIEKKNAMIDKLKSKNHHRKSGIINQIQNIKGFWQTLNQDDQENKEVTLKKKVPVNPTRSILKDHNFDNEAQRSCNVGI